MRLFLSDLIRDDLAQIAYFGSDVVASEESIRLMVDVYRTKGQLVNPHFIKKEKFYSFLEQKILELKNTVSLEHIQCIIEIGSRSLVYQSNPGTIHYCALDLYFRPGLKPIAFVADHYRGYDGFYEDFKKAAALLGVQFCIAGGAHYQADMVHCPIFTLHHLLLTARDREMLPFLEAHISRSGDPDHIFINWQWLSPKYLLLSQSVGLLLQYIDTVKTQEALPADLPSSILSTSGFALKLSNTLFPLNAPSHSENQKLRNKAVKLVAAELSGDAALALDTFDKFSESELITLCYQSQYPLLHLVLQQALGIAEAIALKEQTKSKPHPIMKLAFEHANVLELCFKNEKMITLFTSPSILTLMHHELINPFLFFNDLVMRNNTIMLNKAALHMAWSNLAAVDTYAQKRHLHPEALQDEVHRFLFSPKTHAFFKIRSLTSLFTKGCIKLAMIEQIKPHEIDRKDFEVLTSNKDKITYLNEKFSLSISLPACELWLLVEDSFADVTYRNRLDSLESSLSFETSPTSGSYLGSPSCSFGQSSTEFDESTDSFELPAPSKSPSMLAPARWALLWDCQKAQSKKEKSPFEVYSFLSGLRDPLNPSVSSAKGVLSRVGVEDFTKSTIKSLC